MTREAEDERTLLEARSEADFKTAVFAGDLINGLRNYKRLFEEKTEEGHRPETERDFKMMMLEMKRLEVAGEL